MLDRLLCFRPRLPPPICRTLPPFSRRPSPEFPVPSPYTVRVQTGARQCTLCPSRKGGTEPAFGKGRPSRHQRQHMPSFARTWEMLAMSDRRRPAAAPMRQILVAAVLVVAVSIGALPLSGVIAQATPVLAHSTLHDLPTPNGERSQDYVVDKDGRSVGATKVTASDPHTFLLHDSAMSDLGTLGGSSSQAGHVTEPGRILGAADIKDRAPLATRSVAASTAGFADGWATGPVGAKQEATGRQSLATPSPSPTVTPSDLTAPSGTETPAASPVAGAAPIATPVSLSPCRDVMRSDFNGKTRDLLADCTTDRPILVPEEWVFDGGDHTIFAVDPDDGRLTGGVVMVTGASGTVRHVTIDGAGLSMPCIVDRGQTALTGVIFRGASGEVSGVTVRNVARPLPAAATSPAVPPVSERESCGTGIAVLGRNASVVVTETVIENVGYVGVLVEVGQASISHTTIDRAVDTGILALLGAHVRISPSNQIRNSNVGIQLEGAGTGGRVAGNTIETMALMGVVIIDGAQASIADNHIADTTVNGIAIEGSTTEATVENNQLDEPGDVGIKATGRSAEIRGNTVSGGVFGIGIGNGGTAQVVDNTMSRPEDTGIYVLHEGTVAMIDGNTVADAASDGIWVEQGAHATITGNTVTDAKSNGITAISGADVVISGDNSVRGGEREIELGDRYHGHRYGEPSREGGRGRHHHQHRGHGSGCVGQHRCRRPIRHRDPRCRHLGDGHRQQRLRVGGDRVHGGG